MQEQQSRQGGQQHTYFVNDQKQQTSKDELSVQRILEKAGVQARQEEGQEALLTELRAGQRVEHKDLNATIRIQDDARFETAGGRGGNGREGDRASGGSKPDLGSTAETSGSGQRPGQRPEPSPGATPSDRREGDRSEQPSAKDVDRPRKQ